MLFFWEGASSKSKLNFIGKTMWLFSALVFCSENGMIMTTQHDPHVFQGSENPKCKIGVVPNLYSRKWTDDRYLSNNRNAMSISMVFGWSSISHPCSFPVGGSVVFFCHRFPFQQDPTSRIFRRLSSSIIEEYHIFFSAGGWTTRLDSFPSSQAV